jgi:hypothetical protein
MPARSGVRVSSCLPLNSNGCRASRQCREGQEFESPRAYHLNSNGCRASRQCREGQEFESPRAYHLNSNGCRASRQCREGQEFESPRAYHSNQRRLGSKCPPPTFCKASRAESFISARLRICLGAWLSICEATARTLGTADPGFLCTRSSIQSWPRRGAVSGRLSPGSRIGPFRN